MAGLTVKLSSIPKLSQHSTLGLCLHLCFSIISDFRRAVVRNVPAHQGKQGIPDSGPVRLLHGCYEVQILLSVHYCCMFSRRLPEKQLLYYSMYSKVVIIMYDTKHASRLLCRLDYQDHPTLLDLPGLK